MPFERTAAESTLRLESCEARAILRDLVVRDRADSERIVDLRQGIHRLEVVEDVSLAVVQRPVNHRLNQAGRKLGWRQGKDARRAKADGAIHGEELLDFADPIL